MAVTLLLISLVTGDVPDKVAEALALAIAPTQTPDLYPFDDYALAYRKAVATNRPLIVWVGQRPRTVGGCIICHQAAFEGYPAKCVIISRPRDGCLWWQATVEGEPTDKEVSAALHIYKQASLPGTGSDAIGVSAALFRGGAALRISC